MIDLEPDQVESLDLEISGARLRIRCVCERRFDSMQTTLGGLPIAVHVCPDCGRRLHSSPETSLAVIARFVPDRPVAELLKLNHDLTELAENWHRRGPWPQLLDVGGVPLGPPMERELQAHLLNAVFRAPRSVDR